MSYTEAVIFETLRFATLAPTAVPHCATESGQLRGYHVPKGSVVVANLLNVHRTGKWWKDPHEFNPENFLDENGALANVNFNLTFSVGKRLCLGDVLAKQELFIFLTGLLQRFEFRQHPDHPLPCVQKYELHSLIRAPLPYLVVAHQRSTD